MPRQDVLVNYFKNKKTKIEKLPSQTSLLTGRTSDLKLNAFNLVAEGDRDLGKPLWQLPHSHTLSCAVPGAHGTRDPRHGPCGHLSDGRALGRGEPATLSGRSPIRNRSYG